MAGGREEREATAEKMGSAIRQRADEVSRLQAKDGLEKEQRVIKLVSEQTMPPVVPKFASPRMNNSSK